MYIERTFIYLILLILLLMGYMVWKNERKVSKLEAVVTLLNDHGKNTDTILRNTMEVLEDILTKVINMSKELDFDSKNNLDM